MSTQIETNQPAELPSPAVEPREVLVQVRDLVKHFPVEGSDDVVRAGRWRVVRDLGRRNAGTRG
jgi:hypothetical protein